MFELFDEHYDKLEIFLIIFLFTFIFIFILYVIISNKKDSKILIDSRQSLRKKDKTLRINFDEETIIIYDNSNRKIIAKYTLREFKSLIEYKYVDIFEDWLNKVKERKQNSKLVIGLYLINTSNSQKNYVKFTLLNYNRKTREVFAKMEEVNRSIQFSEKLMDNKEFYASINNILGVNKNNVKGTIVALKITNMDFLRKRYGNENANILLGEMFQRIAKLNQEDDVYATYVQNNTFCIFKVGIKDKKQAKSYVSSLVFDITSEEVKILNKQILPSINVSYSIYGEKTYDIKLAVSLTIKSLEKTTFKFVKNRYIFNDSSIDNEVITQNNDIEIIREIIANNNFKIAYEPIISTEKLSILGFSIHSKFKVYNEDDNFLTVYNICEKYGLKNEFLYMYYRHLFNEILKSNPSSYRMFIKVEVSHLEIIKNVWLENIDYTKIHLVLVFNYEEVVHPKTSINFNQVISDFIEMRIRFALLADENMLTIISNIIYRVDFIIFDEFMINNLESNDMKQISIDNIMNNTQNHRVKYIAYGINKYEQAEILNKLDVDNLAGNYISLPLSDIHNQEFLNNRSIQALRNEPDM